MSSPIDSMTHHTVGVPGPLPEGKKNRIWRLQYGPCWCHGLPGETGSFNFVRTSSCEAALGNLGFNILILSDRVIDGAQPVYRQVLDQSPEPRLVVAVAACPATARFWGELPVPWSPIADSFPIDIHVEECINGRPESLMAAVLNHALSQQTSIQQDHGVPLRTTGQSERDAVAH